MQFNELGLTGPILKAIESEKYNLSSFKGNFKEKVSILKDGLINVSAKGTLNLHGVDQDVIVNIESEFVQNGGKFITHVPKVEIIN